jgi:hypothetical protein
LIKAQLKAAPGLRFSFQQHPDKPTGFIIWLFARFLLNNNKLFPAMKITGRVIRTNPNTAKGFHLEM